MMQKKRGSVYRIRFNVGALQVFFVFKSVGSSTGKHKQKQPLGMIRKRLFLQGILVGLSRFELETSTMSR